MSSRWRGTEDAAVDRQFVEKSLAEGIVLDNEHAQGVAVE
jgi:hypothetical protein